MNKLAIKEQIQFKDEKFNKVLLLDKPELRLALLCLRAGQQVPEHSAPGAITVQGISGHATFYEGDEACEMTAGVVIELDPGRLHRLEARTDAALLVTMIKVAAASKSTVKPELVIELGQLPRPERHTAVFNAFDDLAVGETFVIVNDHDPQPLRIQIEQMREGEMRWDYLEKGPENVRVRLTRITPPAARMGRVNTGTESSPVRIGA